MAYLGMTKNDFNTPVSEHTCDTCGERYTICPATETGKLADNCLADNCQSYDPENDVDILFMTDDEIAKEKPIVSMEMLRKRKEGKV